MMLPAPRPWIFVAVMLAAVTLVLAGAVSGFFYAYSSSVMRGLDATAPAHAIAAMRGINATVRNGVFGTAFFGMPIAAVLSGVTFLALKHREAGLAMLLAAAVYGAGAFLPTFAVSVPMNNALAAAAIPADAEQARGVWQAYSTSWTWWNGFRTIFSMVSLILVGIAIHLGAGCGPTSTRRR